mgnify:CR=1 FL=1
MTAATLDLADIQAQFGGFDRHWPVGRFFYVRWDAPAAGRALLARLPPLAPCLHLDDLAVQVAVNVAFTHAGLAALGLEPGVLDSFPEDFRQGMRARAPLNGDVGLNAPEHWDAAWQERGFVSDHAAERVHWATDVDSALDQIAEALSTVRATAEADPLG